MYCFFQNQGRLMLTEPTRLRYLKAFNIEGNISSGKCLQQGRFWKSWIYARVVEFGRHKGLKIPRRFALCRFESGPGHHRYELQRGV